MMDLLLVGLVSILGQAVLLRELNVAFFGVDLIYALSLGFWLIWTALGALIGRRNLSPGRNRFICSFCSSPLFSRSTWSSSAAPASSPPASRAPTSPSRSS